MLRPSILLISALLPLQTFAFDCKGSEKESFPTFFERFSHDKRFAVSRTIYPIRSIKWEFGADDKGNDVSAPTRSTISKETNSKAPALSAYMTDNGLTARTKPLSQRVVEIEVLKPDTDWIVIFRFARKGHCWFFTEYEDQSL